MKKIYVKPEIELFELRPEERFAANSNNCRAERGAVGSAGNPCDPAGLWSHQSPDVP